MKHKCVLYETKVYDGLFGFVSAYCQLKGYTKDVALEGASKFLENVFMADFNEGRDNALGEFLHGEGKETICGLCKRIGTIPTGHA